MRQQTPTSGQTFGQLIKSGNLTGQKHSRSDSNARYFASADNDSDDDGFRAFRLRNTPVHHHATPQPRTRDPIAYDHVAGINEHCDEQKHQVNQKQLSDVANIKQVQATTERVHL